MSIDSQTLLYLISITDEYNTDPEYSLARFAPPNLPYRIIELQQAQLCKGIAYDINVVELLGIRGIPSYIPPPM